MFDDRSSTALRVALAGLSARQNEISNNIANVDTPGFKARKVMFEESLQTAVAQGVSPALATPTVHRSLEPTRLNGNNVNLDEETLSHIDTMLRYQLAIRALDGKYSTLREAIKGA
ncbi:MULTISPECIES: flagellar basal body rod protein FlgB [Actinoplanes]|uniref:flagellar basal body rod protein FlgB n=1 Tax=Actinoplanes TaxID=1865 RepID=UPI0005F2DA48|nr:MULTISPECIES: flagellar basal body rod protein FlgB [Actinoplanes]GLY03263.1 flagellar basal body rod protein FlgB [Actinoplanes sp. NBRC 101535]